MSLFSHAREWIYYRTYSGTFHKRHRISGNLLIAGLLLLPWLKVGGHPIVRADLPARRLYLVGQIFTANDGFLIALLALLAAFLLFFVSALFGRLWCGWLCPQTVFLEEWVRRVETFFEGDGPARKRLDAAPWTANKAARKAGKIGTLTALSLLLGMGVMQYFAGAQAIWTGHGGPVDYLLVLIIAGGFLADWLWFREQLCIYLCPYARFQSVLTDDHSLMVSYDPKVTIGKGRKAAQSGQCIDCKKCVNVCPMGIDIRDGFQLECIQCGLCIDACTSVMEPLKRDTLVRYSTQAADEGRKSRLLRPRTAVYGALVTGLAVTLLSNIALHNPIEVTLNRSPGTLYQVDDDGLVRNTYLLRVVNNDAEEEHTFAVGVTGSDAVRVTVPVFTLAPGEDRTVPLIVRLPPEEATNTRALDVTVRSSENERTVHTTFKGPAGGEG